MLSLLKPKSLSFVLQKMYSSENRSGIENSQSGSKHNLNMKAGDILAFYRVSCRLKDKVISICCGEVKPAGQRSTLTGKPSTNKPVIRVQSGHTTRPADYLRTDLRSAYQLFILTLSARGSTLDVVDPRTR